MGTTGYIGYFDPLGLTADGDIVKFNRVRAIEIKHGRIAMLAMLHTFVTYFFTIPGHLSTSAGVKFADVPAGWGGYKLFYFNLRSRSLLLKIQRRHQEMFNLSLNV